MYTYIHYLYSQEMQHNKEEEKRKKHTHKKKKNQTYKQLTHAAAGDLQKHKSANFSTVWKRKKVLRKRNSDRYREPQQRFIKPQIGLYTICAMHSVSQHRQSGVFGSGYCCFSDCRCFGWSRYIISQRNNVYHSRWRSLQEVLGLHWLQVWFCTCLMGFNSILNGTGSGWVDICG